MPLVRIGRLEDAVLHPTGHRDLLGEVLFGLHHGIVDLVVGCQHRLNIDPPLPIPN